MAAINICRDNKDPFYRYKMPPIVSKVEGRGNGIKTAVVNTSDVARALSRPPAYIIKFFGFELGALTAINDDSERYIVNGAHDAGKLQDLLDSFINKFVLCSSCKNPETDIIVLKDGNLTRDCKACGQRSFIDPRHKLSSYILKNPPSKSKKKAAATASANVGGGMTAAEAAADAGALNGNASPTTGGGPSDDYEEGHSDDDELARRINAEAQNLPSADFKAAENDDNWAVDVSEEAVRARKAQLEKSLGALNLDEDEDEAGEADERYNELGEWVASEHPSDVDIYKRAKELGIDQKKHTVEVLSQTLFTDKVVSEIPDHAGLLGMLVKTKNHEKSLLGGIERLVGLQYPDLVKSVPNILFKLYEHDLISEDVVTKWGSRASKKYVDKETSKKVRKAAKPFLEWLEQQSDEESEDDSE